MQQERGFSLMELMIVLAIAAILAAVALPSFDSWLQQERHTRAVNQLQAIYHFARSEAVKREASIAVTATAAQVSVIALEDEQVLRQFELSSRLSVSLMDVELLATGQVPASARWQVRDPRGYATDRCLIILPSGQLTVQASSCAT